MDEKLNQGEDSVGMTDLQFLSYKEERDKREALEKAELLRQIDALRGNASAYCGEGMTDLQFYAAERERWSKREQELLLELERFHGGERVQSAEGMTDFQYKNTIEMIYQILKANFEAGKTPEEILKIIAALKNEINDAGFNKL